MSAARLRAVYVLDGMQDVRLVEGFASRFDLTLLVPSSIGDRVLTWPAQRDGFRTAILPGGRAGFVLRAARWLVRERTAYDAIIAAEELTAALAANLAGLRTGQPVVLQLGRTSAEYFRCRRAAGQRGPRYWAGLAAVTALAAVNERRAAAIGCSSEYIATAVRPRARLARAIPAYGVDVEAFAPRPSRREARRTLGLPEDATLVLWRSRLAPEKDPQTFLRSLALLREGGRPVQGLYVGAEFRDVAALAEAHGVPLIGRDAVHPLRELPLYYRSADVVVQTSRAEGLGLSPVEALACETPVVASAVGGLRETVRDRQTGLLVPRGDARATADAIAWMLDNPEEARAMARRGRALVIERYTAERAFDAWEALVREVVAASNGSAEGRPPGEGRMEEVER